ncbi:MAG: agmatine deiminase family protein [Candidatus Zixiibacteriota bacterium]
MKKTLILLILLISVISNNINSANDVTEEEFLPIGLTEEEKLHLDEIGMSHRGTAPPTGIIRNPAEWEPSQGVIIRWPLGISVSLVAEMSEDLMVTTIVSSTYQQNNAISSYTSGGVNMANAQFIIAPTNSIWTRDYGPWFIFQNEQPGIVDHIYNRPRPYDDLIPQVIGTEWGIPVYGMDLITAGGNHMSDGLGMSMSTRLVYDENPTKTSQEVDSIMNAYLGNDYTVLEYIEYGGIHHIDCWAKFLNPTTILIKDVSPSNSSYNLLNARADYLSQQISAWGQPYTIVRVYCPSGTAYTNSLILNKKVLVPIFSNSYDNIALQVYENAMPGYEVLGFYGSWYDDDAIHCRAMGVPDLKMLFIDHTPLVWSGDTLNDYLITTYISPYSNTSLIPESLKVYYSVNDGQWGSVPLTSSIEQNYYDGYIPAQSPGSQVSYYIKAADNSEKVETHPYIGQPGAHQFIVNVAPQIISVDSFVCRTDHNFNYYPEIIDIDDTSNIIFYSDYPSWLTVQNDSLVGVSPDSSYLINFDVTVSDEYSSTNQAVVLFVYICGDIDCSRTVVDIADLVYFVDYSFSNPAGPQPPVMEAADIDGSGEINIADIVYLVSYMFDQPPGPEPVCEL